MSRSPTNVASRRSWRPLAPAGGAGELPLSQGFPTIPAPPARPPSALAQSQIRTTGFVEAGYNGVTRQTSERPLVSPGGAAALPRPSLPFRSLTPIPALAGRRPSELTRSLILTKPLVTCDTSWLEDAEDDWRDTVVYRPSPVLQLSIAVWRLLGAVLTQTVTYVFGKLSKAGSHLRARISAKGLVMTAGAATACVLAALAIASVIRDGWRIDIVRREEPPIQLTQRVHAASAAAVKVKPNVSSLPSEPSEDKIPDVSSLPLEAPDVASDVTALPLEPPESAATDVSSLQRVAPTAGAHAPPSLSSKPISKPISRPTSKPPRASLAVAASKSRTQGSASASRFLMRARAAWTEDKGTKQR